MKRLTMALAALVAATAAGPLRAERCGPDASFAALASADCSGGQARATHEPHSFDALSAAALHKRGKEPSSANAHAHALNAVPEPGTLALLAAGLAAIVYRLLRRGRS